MPAVRAVRLSAGLPGFSLFWENRRLWNQYRRRTESTLRHNNLIQTSPGTSFIAVCRDVFVIKRGQEACVDATFFCSLTESILEFLVNSAKI